MTYSELIPLIQPFLQQLVAFVAYLILAIVVFIIGYLISIGIGKLIAEILKSIKFNRLFEKEGWKRALQRANVEVNPAEFIGVIFKWVFVIVSLVIAIGVLSSVLNLASFNAFLAQVLGYLPNVITAVLVFVVVIVISDLVEKVVRATVERLKVGYGYIASSIVKWAIWVFTFFLILGLLLPPQANALVQILYSSIVYGVVAALALGIGLAIGLGGKETAGKIISDIYRKIEER